ncbi:MAG: peptidylprolyl isomerase [Euryarchaeota archaeon]|nr:peptidylprolyl isomerase [Euryarchaeota archaeon]
MIVSIDKVVKVHYQGFVTATNELFDSSLEIKPLTFLVGHKQMISGFEEEILGLKISDKRKFTLVPERAYGHKNMDLIVDRAYSDFPEGTKVGTMFQAEIDSIPMPFKVTNINPEKGESGTVTCDFNHPMAGKELTFEVEIVHIRQADEEEIAHGHAHGDDGYQH